MSERIDWVKGTPRELVKEYAEWRDAVATADAGDLAAIIYLLRSDADLNIDSKELLADLLERHRLAKKKGGQAVPSYRSSLLEGQARQAEKLVAYHRKKGLSVDEAIAQALIEREQEKRELRGDSPYLTEEEIDALTGGDDFFVLQNRIKRNRK